VRLADLLQIGCVNKKLHTLIFLMVNYLIVKDKKLFPFTTVSSDRY
jgi:hypothetical protein